LITNENACRLGATRSDVKEPTSLATAVGETPSGGAVISAKGKRSEPTEPSAFPGTARDESYVHGTTDEYKAVYPWLDGSAMEVNLALHAGYYAAHEAGKKLISSFGQGRTAGRFTVLRALFLGGRKLTQNEIASRLMITSASVTFLIDGLEKEGLVERSTNEQDRRITDVALTSRGEEACGQLIPAMARLAAHFCDGFSDAEKKIFAGYLMRFWHNAAKAP
jgi:DNA-binding MarR family transcriptional regulator